MPVAQKFEKIQYIFFSYLTQAELDSMFQPMSNEKEVSDETFDGVFNIGCYL